MDSFKWVEVVNRWFTGGYVTEDEIVQLATLNMSDFCEQFRSAVRECVITFCQQHATATPRKAGLSAEQRRDP